MNVLLASSTLDDDGGMPVCVGHLATALAAAGHRVTIVGQRCGEHAPAIAAAGRTTGVEIVDVRRPWTTAGQFAAARDMDRFVAAWLRRRRGGPEPAVVHTHGVWTPAIIAAAEACRRDAADLVISPHGMLRSAAMRRSRLLKRLAWTVRVRRHVATAQAVHASSVQEARDLEKLTGGGLRPLVIPWGIDPAGAVRRGPAVPGPRIAACYGRMLPIKGLDMLVDAWAASRPAGWQLRLAGPCDAAMRGDLDRRIAARGLGDSVRLEPAFARPDLPRMLSDISLLVVPSRSENFSLIVGEALAAGVPVITTTETAWHEVVEQGCGWCVAPEAGEIAAVLRTATAAPPEALDAMGRRGAAWVAEAFAWSSIAGRIVRELYLPAS